MPGAPAKNQKRRMYRRKPKISFEQRVKKICLKDQEQKIKTFQLLENTNTRGTGLLFGTTTTRRGVYVENMLASSVLNMTQGTNQQERIGNEIHGCKLNIKGYINANVASAADNNSPYPFEVHILVYKRKNSQANDPSQILNYPDNTNGSITGSAITSMLAWNKKDYVIKKHRIFRMKGNPQVAVSTAPNVVGIENPSFNAGDYQFFKRFSIDVPIKDKLQFSDLGTSPNNDWCALGIYVVNGDGSTLLNQQQRCNVNAVATLRYKDA